MNPYKSKDQAKPGPLPHVFVLALHDRTQSNEVRKTSRECSFGRTFAEAGTGFRASFVFMTTLLLAKRTTVPYQMPSRDARDMGLEYIITASGRTSRFRMVQVEEVDVDTPWACFGCL